jgi:hypothetical protein
MHIFSLDNKNVRRCINLLGLEGITDKNRYGSEDIASYRAMFCIFWSFHFYLKVWWQYATLFVYFYIL